MEVTPKRVGLGAKAWRVKGGGGGFFSTEKKTISRHSNDPSGELLCPQASD